MNILNSLENMMVYLYEGFASIFSPSHDAYPAIGVSPFDGIPYKGSGWES